MCQFIDRRNTILCADTLLTWRNDEHPYKTKPSLKHIWKPPENQISSQLSDTNSTQTFNSLSSEQWAVYSRDWLRQWTVGIIKLANWPVTEPQSLEWFHYSNEWAMKTTSRQQPGLHAANAATSEANFLVAIGVTRLFTPSRSTEGIPSNYV